MQKIIGSLNPPQKEAVAHLNGPVLILAGAGTGKTRVLTTRLANLIATGTASPMQIMAVTFTNKASKEMKARVEQIIGHGTAGMWLGTFHSIGRRILQAHAEQVNLTPNFTILNTDDQKRLLDQILKDYNIDTSAYPARLLASIVSKWKDNAWLPNQVPKAEEGFAGGKAIALYGEYQRRLQALNAVDFGDLLLLPVHLFKEHPQILAEYQQRLTHVLVDEYQDTNTVQYMFLRLLTITNKNLCVVGDDDQSIYGWRGAQVENILKFEKDFPGTKVVRLEQNYRSTDIILRAASELISKNKTRHSKTLWTADSTGDKIEVYPVVDDREESCMIADACDSHHRAGNPYSDCAVLFRTAAQTRSLEEQFIKTGVPYVVIGGLKFYDRKEIRDAVAYLRLINNPADSLAFQRICNVPRRGVGNNAIQTIQHIANQQNLPLFASTKIALEQTLLTGKAKNELPKFVEQITVWQNLGDSLTPDRLLEQVLEESGYAEMLRNDKKDPDNKTRLENLKELVRAMQDYPDLGAFLEHIALVSDGDELTNEDVVSMMTVHAAKGLEFDTVFLPGFEDGLFPHQRSLNEEGMKGVEEERRLAYVAITRAKRRLVISHAFSRRMYGQFTPCTVSRFLQEIPEDCLDIKPASTSSMYGNFAHRPQWGSRTDLRTSGNSFAKPAEPLIPVNNSENKFPIGSRIFHQKFGYGRIYSREGAGEQESLTIEFEKAGSKTLRASLANLEMVS